MQSIKLLAIASAILSSHACVLVIDGDGTLTLINDSDYVIDEVRLAERADSRFGTDLTGTDSLFPAETLAIDLPCADYDLLLVNPLGTRCVHRGIDVCVDETVLRLSNSLINFCTR